MSRVPRILTAFYLGAMLLTAQTPGERSAGVPLTFSPQFLPSGFGGSPYSVTFTVNEGTPPYTFTKSSGSFPAGISLSPAGVLSGTSTSLGGSFFFEIQVQDSTGRTGTQSYDVFFTGPPLTVLPATIPNGALGQNYSVTFSATGGAGTYTFSQGNTIPGIFFDAQTGGFSGTPILSGTFTFRITAQSGASTGSRVYTINISGNNTLLWGPTTLPGGTVGIPYNQMIVAGGGNGSLLTPPVTWTVSNGIVPPGISKVQSSSSTVVFTGNPSVAGSYPFRLTGTDAAGLSSSLDYTIVVAGQAIAVGPESIPSGFTGVPYSTVFTAAGGTPPYTFTSSSPASITPYLSSSSGVFSFLPMAGTEEDFSITATDSLGAHGTRFYHLSIASATLRMFPVAFPHATLQVPYALQWSGSGGSPPYTFSLTNGTLPAGVSLSSSGNLSGTPQQAGFFNDLIVTVRDSLGASGYIRPQFIVDGAAITLGPATLPDATGGVPYAAQITASGGVPPYTFAKIGGLWPAGMNFNSNGSFSGTPDEGNVMLSAVVVATDAIGSTGTRTFQFRLRPSTPVVLTFMGTNSFTTHLGDGFGPPIVVNGLAFLPMTFSAVGALPPGITLSFDGNNIGFLHGPATTVGTFPFTIRAADADGVQATRQYTLTVTGATPTFSPTTLPAGSEGQPYSLQFNGVNGSPPYTYSVTSGQLPTGMSLSPSGLLSGSAALPKFNSFTVTLQDSQGATFSSALSLLINPLPIEIGPESVPDAFLGESYSAQLTALHAQAPYSFNLLPPQDFFFISSSGRISGTPRGEPRVQTVSFSVVDINGTQGTRQYTVNILARALQISPDSVPQAAVGQQYSVTFTAAGGRAPYTFSLENGVPAGLTLTAAGVLSGIPVNTNALVVNLKVVDADGRIGRRLYTIDVGSSLFVTPATLPQAQQHSPYNVTFQTTGGASPYAYSLAGANPLPDGLSISSAGVLSGTPTKAGTFEFSIEVRDFTGRTRTSSFTFLVNAVVQTPVVITTASIRPAVRGTTFGFLAAASGGTVPYSFTITQGSPPPGLSLSTNGVLGGVPTSAGSFSFTITVTDKFGQTDSRNLTMTVTSPQETNTLLVDPPQLSFHIASRGAKISAAQCIAVLTSGAAAAVQGSVTGSPLWAKLASAQLQTPGAFCVSADAISLTPGNYSNVLQLTTSGAQPANVSIPLTLLVDPPSPAHFVLPQRLQIQSERGSNPLFRSLAIANEGGKDATFQVSPPAASWLTVNPTSGLLPAGGSMALALRIDPSALNAGVYETELLFSGDSTNQAVAVQFIVGPPGGGLLELSQSALEFVVWQGGKPVSSTVGLINQSSIALSPIASVEGAGAADWLRVALHSASLAPGEATPVDVTAGAGSLAPGHYSAWIAVQASGALNGKQISAVGMTVLAPNSPLPADAQIRGLALTPLAPQGSLVIALPPGGPLTFSTTIKSSDPGWLTVTPAQGSIPAGGVLTLTASANLPGRAPGLYSSLITLGLSDGTIRSIPVDLFVPSPASAAAAAEARSAQQVCGGGQSLVGHLLSPGPGFVARVGRALRILVQAETCTGAPAQGLDAHARVGTQEIVLLPESGGVWSGSWLPNISAAAANLRVTLSRLNPLATISLEASGQVMTGSNEDPLVKAVVPAATQALNDPLAAGGWITIYGDNLASAETLARTSSLPVTLSDVVVLVGGVPAPLYYVSSSQVNAVLPRSSSPGVQYQLVLQRSGKASAPVNVVVAAVRPGLFTLNQQGSGQAAALLAGTASLASASTPVARGAVLELYGAAFGAVDHPPAGDGEPASLTQFARTDAPVSATVGGRAAEVLFSGLTPGSIGLYQVNIRIPDDAPIGAAVEVTVTQQGVRSNTVTVGIR
ncbi:MAG: putative Ig domain-containing protein [Acidobacteriota bacterium]